MIAQPLIAAAVLVALMPLPAAAELPPFRKFQREAPDALMIEVRSVQGNCGKAFLAKAGDGCTPAARGMNFALVGDRGGTDRDRCSL